MESGPYGKQILSQSKAIPPKMKEIPGRGYRSKQAYPIPDAGYEPSEGGGEWDSDQEDDWEQMTDMPKAPSTKRYANVGTLVKRRRVWITLGKVKRRRVRITSAGGQRVLASHWGHQSE